MASCLEQGAEGTTARPWRKGGGPQGRLENEWRSGQSGDQLRVLAEEGAE